MNLGENTPHVVEVLDLVGSGSLFCSSLTPSPGRAVNDLEVAKVFAWSKTYGQDELTWSDIRSERISEVWAIAYENGVDELVDKQIAAALEDVASIVERQLDARHRELLDDIVADLKGCIYSRLFQGISNPFFEEILTIYRSGGWPCGWDGDWPEGNLLTYRQEGTTDVATG
jgi:hypothetical protein